MIQRMPVTDSELQFMLLANSAVAQQIAVHLPEQAFLRRHDTPLERRMVCFTKVLPHIVH